MRLAVISLKLAFLSVIRRPKQNIAVILGITLGVSLFLGVQIGSDSLGAGLSELTSHSLGQTDASISSAVTPFIVTPDVINELLNNIPPQTTLLQQLLASGPQLQY